jgi:hypothetical protein
MLENYLKKNSHLGRKHVFYTFFKLGAPKSSLNRWLTLLFNKKDIKRKVGSGRIATIATKVTIKKMKIYFNHKSGRSQKRLQIVIKQVNHTSQ